VPISLRIISVQKQTFFYRFYMRSKSHKLINAPHVDNSYKWAGGGVLSTVSDLLSFGNAILYSYQVKTSFTIDR
jgi:hypothetical protein